MKLKRAFVGIIAALALCFSLTACFPGADSVPQPTTDSFVPAPAPSNAADEEGQMPSVGEAPEEENDTEDNS